MVEMKGWGEYVFDIQLFGVSIDTIFWYGERYS